MAVQLTVVAASPAELASIWGQLGGRSATVDLHDDDVLITVDLTTPRPEAVDDQVEQEPIEDLADPVEVVRQTYIAEAEAAEADHDGHTVDIGPVAEVEPESAGDGTPTVRDQVVTLLNAHPNRTFTVAQVYEHVDGSTSGSVGATLKWLTNNGRIRRVGRGQYQALDRSAVHDARRQAAAAGMFGG